MKNRRIIDFALIVMFSYLLLLQIVFGSDSDIEEKATLKENIQKAYDVKCKSIMRGDWKELKEYYDTSKKYAKWSYEHEVKRIKYLNDWSKDRGIKFTDIKSVIDLKRIQKKADVYLVSISEIWNFNYIYEDDEDKKVNEFCIFLEHSIGMIYKNDKWLITRDWYSDCFENSLGPYNGIYIGNPDESIKEESKALATAITNKHHKYDRQKAVEYADKYWLKYNYRYKNCNGVGGDCTNYVSQCIGDKEEGGGIDFDRTWFCVYPEHGRAEGSKAFVNADAFKVYLVYSGRGRVIKKGDFEDVTKPTDDSNIGAAGKLQVGDLICYEVKNQIDHFGIITAKDSKGYPMVNTHTVERYHVPFDLGWRGKGIKFHLIRIPF